MNRLARLDEGFYVAVSTQFVSNTVVVRGAAGSLVVDPGVTVEEVAGLAADLATLQSAPELGFSTHPHWDHLIWSTALGSVPRFATRRAVEIAQGERDGLIEGLQDAAPGHDLGLFAQITPMAGGIDQLTWSGPRAIVLEHQAHAPGHAAVFFPQSGILLAGDMLSDIEIPLLDLDSVTAVADYRRALDQFAALTGVALVVPGHGHPGNGAEFRRRVEQDQRYLDALESGAPHDPRLSAQWLAEEFERQRNYLTNGGR